MARDAVDGAAGTLGDDLDRSLAGALRLPDGTWVRARGLRRAVPAGPDPDFGLYLGSDHRPVWEHEYIAWPDFWLPRDPVRAAHLLRIAYERARVGERVEIACPGGRGRTGSALGALAILSGCEPGTAVAWVRRHYARRAVETPWQRRWVREFPELLRRSLDQ